MAQISFRLTDELHSLIEGEAARTGQSINALLTSLTTRHLEDTTLGTTLRVRTLHAANAPMLGDALGGPDGLGGAPEIQLPFPDATSELLLAESHLIVAPKAWVPSPDDLDLMVVSPSWRTPALPLFHHAVARNCAGATSALGTAAGVFSAFAETHPMVSHNAFHAVVAASAAIAHISGDMPPRIPDATAARVALRAWTPLSLRGEPNVEMCATILSTVFNLEGDQ